MNEDNSKGRVVLSLRGSIAEISLGRSDEKAIILDRNRLQSLDKAIDTVANDKSLHGLIISAPREDMFCAGADINIIGSISSKKEGESLAKSGQDIFNRIEDLPIPVVAIISGPCVGGGCELALACDYRILINHPTTRIGLPEVKLGIIPGFGGTQRLPRLVGLPIALDSILKGKLQDPNSAKKIGLATELINFSNAEETRSSAMQTARQLLLGKMTAEKTRMSFLDQLLTNIGIGRSIVASKARKSVVAKFGNHYPAPFKAIEIATEGLKSGLKRGLRLEAKAIGELASGEVCKSLIHLYFLRENARKLGSKVKDEIKEGQIGIIGAGTMGSGIAAVCLQAGYRVVLLDKDKDARIRAVGKITGILASKRNLSSQDRSDILARLVDTDIPEELASSKLLIEAVFEDIEIKKQILGKIADVVDDRAIIASNTSSLSLGALAEELRHPERVVGMHFFNPAEKMPLLEIIQHKFVSNRTILHAAAYADIFRKVPIVVDDVPGFLINRLLSPYLLEAAHLLREGFPIEVIDKAAVNFGLPMGPCRLLDEIGLDVASNVAKIIEAGYGERMHDPGVSFQLLSAGLLGKKSGEGFYEYKENKRVNKSVYEIINVKVRQDITSEDLNNVEQRLIFSMLNEGICSFHEGVAGEAGPEAAAQVDLGTVFGMGFPPFHGGLMRYAEKLGSEEISKTLKRLCNEHGKRFTSLSQTQV